MRKRPLAERFWEKVDKSGECWTWTASRNAQGYGQIAMKSGVNRHAHRVAWLLEHGSFPSLDVLHRCDNPPCVRIDHLYLGDDAQNVKDRRERGREGNHKGSAHGRAKLTEAQVIAMRQLRGMGTYADLGRNYGVSVATVKDILYRRTWTHV